MNDFIDIDSNGFETQITALVNDLDLMADEVVAGAAAAAEESAKIIQREQKRLLSAASFANPTADLASLIKIAKSTSKKYYHFRVGYDSAAIKQHPEVLVIEFGRPGKSARRMKKTDSLGRKKGDFPPQTPHIYPGFLVSREEAANHFLTRLAEIAERRMQG